MTTSPPIVKSRKKSGPQGRWMARCASSLKVSLPHLYLVATGKRESATLEHRIDAWKKKNRVA